VNLSVVAPFDAGTLGDVRPVESVARGHVQVSLPEAAGPFREEVQRRAVERERGCGIEGVLLMAGPPSRFTRSRFTGADQTDPRFVAFLREQKAQWERFRATL
jgi:hypothetical protein